MNGDAYELAAWRWLLELPRLDWQSVSRSRMDGQIRIRVSPGKLHTYSGAPLVLISVEVPGSRKRFIGTGNSLYQACESLSSNLSFGGFKFTHPMELARSIRVEAQ